PALGTPVGNLALAFLALLIEGALGYPDRLLRAVGHPVAWAGALIGLLDRTFNQSRMSPAAARTAGAFALLTLVMVAGLAAIVVERSLLALPFAGAALA